MRKTIVALAALGLATASAAPVIADCIYDVEEAMQVIEGMPDGWQKDAVQRELKMALEAANSGDEKMCLVHVGVCAQYTGGR